MELTRETKIEIRSDLPGESEEVFAVCLESEDVKLLIPFKIYRIRQRGKYVNVIDEAGESAVYPSEFFLALPLPQETSNLLANAYLQAV